MIAAIPPRAERCPSRVPVFHPSYSPFVWIAEVGQDGKGTVACLLPRRHDGPHESYQYEWPAGASALHHEGLSASGCFGPGAHRHVVRRADRGMREATE
jgi:hypothetical protein